MFLSPAGSSPPQSFKVIIRRDKRVLFHSNDGDEVHMKGMYAQTFCLELYKRGFFWLCQFSVFMCVSILTGFNLLVGDNMFPSSCLDRCCQWFPPEWPLTTHQGIGESISLIFYMFEIFWVLFKSSPNIVKIVYNILDKVTTASLSFGGENKTNL